MKRNIVIIITATLLLTLTGCSNYLTEDNKSNTAADIYYSTPAGYNALVNSCYSSLRDVFGGTAVSSSKAGSLNGVVELFCGGTDLYQLYLPSTAPSSDNKGLETYQNLSPVDGVLKTFYTSVYSAIKRCNDAIHYGANQDPVRVAEMRFLRAFYYFQLVQQFGDVALVTDFLTSPITSYERTPAKDVYAFIISEMEDALPTLPATSDPGRANQRVVNHFLALVYLTRGYDANLGGTASDFTKAEQYATAAINGQPLNLDFEKDVFWPGKDINAETLFAVQYSSASLPSTSAGNAWSSYFGGYLGGANSSIGDGIPAITSVFRPTKRLYQLLVADPKDTRFAKTFMQTVYGTNLVLLSYFSYYTTSPKITTVALYYPRPGTDSLQVKAWIAADPANRANAYIAYADGGLGHYNNGNFNGNYIGADGTGWFSLTNSMPVFPHIKKFDCPGTIFSTTSSFRNIPLARLAETYLIRAEAEINSGNTTAAATDINVVRTRSNASPITASQATIDYVLDERAREFAGEYQRWYDLKRTGKLTTYVPMYNPDVPNVSYMQGTGAQYKILRPIPQSAIDLNGAAVTQNPGY